MDNNEITVFQHDVELPPVVAEKAQAAFLSIKEEGWDIMKENKRVKTGRLLRSTAAVAACAALLVAAGTVGGWMLAGEGDDPAVVGRELEDEDKDVSVAMNDVEQTGENMSGAPSDFSLTVYDQENRLAGGQDGGLAFTDIGCGEGGYTGMLFQVQGDDIADVCISVDKGELYTTTVEEVEEAVFEELAAHGLPDEDGDPDTHTVYRLTGGSDCEEMGADQTPLEVTAYYCTKGGAQVEVAYDEKLYYGFYIPDAVTSSEEDLAAAYQERLGVFDGSTLTVTITRRDGSSASKEYTLSVAKLALDENGNVTQQEWIGDGEGFVYGILAKEY